CSWRRPLCRCERGGKCKRWGPGRRSPRATGVYIRAADVEKKENKGVLGNYLAPPFQRLAPIS
ncbi:unnamed protein product, partial [Arctogadus glacialis]